MTTVQRLFVAASIFLLATFATFANARVAGAGSEPAQPLRFNPFEAPDLEARAASGEDAKSLAPVAWAPVLKATLVAGNDSLGDLGGVILRLGEETHGYRLVEVRRWEAVFVRAGQQIVLSVDPRSEQ